MPAAISAAVSNLGCWQALSRDLVWEALADRYPRAMIYHLGSELTLKRICGHKSFSRLLSLLPAWESESLDSRLVLWNLPHPQRGSCKSRPHFCHMGSDFSLHRHHLVFFLWLETTSYVASLSMAFISFLINLILSSNQFQCPYWSLSWQIKSFTHHVSSRDWTQVIRPFNKCLYPTKASCQSSDYF